MKEKTDNLFEVTSNFFNSFIRGYESTEVDYGDNIESYYIGGMGGSGIAGDMLRDVFYNSIDIEVRKDFSIPDNRDCLPDLPILISYSGETKETLSQLQKLRHWYRDGEIMVISNNKEKFNNSSYHFFHIPDYPAPRFAVPYVFGVLLKIVEETIYSPFDNPCYGTQNFITSEQGFSYKHKAIDYSTRLASDMYMDCSDKTMCFISEWQSVGNRWKSQINENANLPAFYEVYPEYNHNGVNGISNNVKKYIVGMEDEEILDKTSVESRDLAVLRTYINDYEYISSFFSFSLRPDTVLFDVLHHMFIADLTSYFLANLFLDVYVLEIKAIDFVKDFN